MVLFTMGTAGALARPNVQLSVSRNPGLKMNMAPSKNKISVQVPSIKSTQTFTNMKNSLSFGVNPNQMGAFSAGKEDLHLQN